MFITKLFNSHPSAFWRGLILSGLLLTAALILTGYFAGGVFLTLFAVLAPPLALLLILLMVPGMVLLGAALWVKIEQAFESLTWRLTHSSEIRMDFERATNRLPVQKDTVTEAIRAEQHPLLLASQEIRKVYPSPIASVDSIEKNSDESTEENAPLCTNYSYPPKKITTHDKDKSAHEYQTITPSPF